MIQLEKITTKPSFSSQLENKILYTEHSEDISIKYTSTYTLKYVIEGTKFYNCNNQDTVVSKNQYLILNKDATITTETPKGTKGFSFFLSPQLIEDVYYYHTNTKIDTIAFFEVLQTSSNNNIGYLLHKISQLYRYDLNGFKQNIEELFMLISEQIIKEKINLDTRFKKLNISKHNTRKELYKLIIATKEYLHDNLKESVSLDTISRDIGISKYYLHRLFTEINSVTPLEYLTIHRLKKAKEKLQYSKDSVFEIAITCGFDNTAYFSNTFKKYTGLSPTQFRNKL